MGSFRKIYSPLKKSTARTKFETAFQSQAVREAAFEDSAINSQFMSLKGTQTEKNLAASFAGECMARTRYTYFSEVAKKQGYEQIAAIFLETAENEREHAKIFFNLLKQSGCEPAQTITSVPTTGIGSTEDNLQAAANGEQEETDVVYPKFAAVADQEGFKNVARTFQLIAAIEKEHELRYKFLLEKVTNGSVFKRSTVIKWKCRNCGYVFEGVAAPRACPVCFFPHAYFEPKERLE
jgi:rubrerythrin